MTATSDAAMSWSMSHGQSVVAVSRDIATIVNSSDVALANELWVAQHHGVDAVLDLLARSGLRAMPDFVLIEREPSPIQPEHDDPAGVDGPVANHAAGVRLVMRGDVCVVVSNGDGEQLIGAGDVRLVTEQRLSAPTAIVAACVADIGELSSAHAAAPAAVMASGCGLFGSLRGVFSNATGDAPPTPVASTDRDATDHADQRVAATAPPASIAAAPEEPAQPARLGATDHGTTADPPDDAEVDNPLDMAQGDRTDELAWSDVALTWDPAATDGPDDGSRSSSQQHATEALVPTGVPVVAEDRNDDNSADEQRYAALFGATIERSVLDAAVRDDEAIAHAEPRSANVGGKGPSPDAPVGAALDLDQTLPPIRDDEPDQWPTEPLRLGDHDGHTMSRDDLEARRVGVESGPGTADAEPADPVEGALAEQVHSASGATVQALRCEHGHDNPPHHTTCSTCGRALAADPVAVARPTLGWLRFSNGQIVEVDRPVLVGRKPDITGIAVTEIPKEFTIEGGDGLSRSHAVFSIAGWQVRVEDLGSTNHTTVRLPGQSAQRLRPGEPVPIADGALIDLGGEVSCRYESVI